MNKKIIQFLEEAGFEGRKTEPAALQLLRYFEEEYGVRLLALLEKEWLDEQVHTDMTHYDFEMLRDFIGDSDLEKFDKVVEKIEAYG